MLVTLLALLVPILLFLIAKKAHSILTMSQLHDTIMTRFYKFLVCKYDSSPLSFFSLNDADGFRQRTRVLLCWDDNPHCHTAVAHAAPV